MSVSGRLMTSSLNRQNLMAIQAGTLKYTWRGVQCIKNPFDFALLFKLLWEVKPQTIMEIGSNRGGSSLLLADIMSLYQIDCHVWSVDLERVDDLEDERITFLQGNALDLSAVFSPAQLAEMPHPWLVLEDCAHLYETSLAVLRFYDPLLEPGDYVVIEDGIVDDMGRSGEFHGGPNRAIKEFFESRPGFYRLDSEYCDFWGHNVTWNTNGYWQRIK